MLEHGLLQALIYLGAAALFVPFFTRIGLGSVLGYLVAGVAIGPWFTGLIPEAEGVQEVAELGVVLLMFLVGLELNPRRLWDLRRQIFGLGSLQVLVTIAGVAAALAWLKEATGPAIALGMAAAMSSTAMALQVLSERKLSVQPPGQAAFAVSLFQDIAVVPLLLAMALLAPGGEEATHFAWRPVIIAVALIVSMIIAGRLLLRPVMRWIAATGMREIFISFALLLVVGSALLTQSIGLSMAMGSFIAGLLLADSDYRVELEVDIDPLKGLFLGLFFMSVGVQIDFGQLLHQPFLIVGLAVAIVLIKVVVLGALGWVFGLRREHCWLFALSLSQVGEFAFVLLAAGHTAGTLNPEEVSIARSVVALSMMCTPLLFAIYDRMIAPRYRTAKSRDADRVEERRPVIVAGMGRFGQVVVRLLRARNVECTIIDNDPAQIETVSRVGWRTYYGDASRHDVLEAAGVADARLVVLAFDDPERLVATARLLRSRYPKVHILARARGRTEAMELERAEVPAIRETFHSALETARQALITLGDDEVSATRTVDRFRVYDEDLLHQMMAAPDAAAAREIFDRGRHQFLELLAAESAAAEADRATETSLDARLEEKRAAKRQARDGAAPEGQD